MRRAIEAAFAIGVLVGCGPGHPPLPADPAPASATYLHTLELPSAGGTRTSLVHVPPRRGQGPMPLLLVLHGGLSDAETLMERTTFRALADRAGFLAVFPNGWGPVPFLRHWNALHCCAKGPRRHHQDDVAFLDALVDDLAGQLPVDRSRVFLVGISNGGMLAYRYAAMRSTRVAGIAALASSIEGALRSEDPALRMPDLEVAVPLVVFHGTADPRVPFEHVEPSIGFWVAQSGCAVPPARETRREGRVVRLRWAPCRDRAEVALYRLEGWGHSWPGPRFTADLEGPLAGFDAAPIIWEFFRRQPPRVRATTSP